MDFPALPDHLDQLVPEVLRAVAPLTPADWRAPYAATATWSRLELLGHLFDSAVNNHQRIVRALIEDEMRFPAYAQNEMVRVQSYHTAEPGALLELWAALNHHIAHVLRQTPAAKLSTPCIVGEDAPIPLERLAHSYVEHLEHHLSQLLGEAAPSLARRRRAVSGDM